MKVYFEIKLEEIAEILFTDSANSPCIDIYEEIEGNEGVGAYRFEVIDFADSLMVCANYYGGGKPFVYDVTDERDFTGLAKSLKEYFTLNSLPEKVYIESIHCDIDKMHSEYSFSSRKRLQIIIEDGTVESVYFNDKEVLCEIIDMDYLNPVHRQEINDELYELKLKIEEGILHRIW